MFLRVLGSSAGGGFPQWNCNCPNCTGVRSGSLKAFARTQSSVAVSTDGQNWLLVNASPDILTQIRQTPALQPARARRDTGIAAVLLVVGEVIKKRVGVLSRYFIPGPIIGGLVFSLIALFVGVVLLCALPFVLIRLFLH